MKFLVALLSVVAAASADVSHLFGSGPSNTYLPPPVSNSYLPPQREPHHRYGVPAQQQVQVNSNSNSDIPESFFRIDDSPSFQQQTSFRQPQHSYGPPPSGPARSQQFEIHVVQAPRQQFQSYSAPPSNQYLPPQQAPIFRQPSAPIFRQPAPVYQPAPVFRQPAPVYQPAPVVYRQPAPVFQQQAPIFQAPVFQTQTPAPVFHQQTFQAPPKFQFTPSPSNQYLPPQIQPAQNFVSQSIAAAPQPSFQVVQPPRNDYLPPVANNNIFQATPQVAQPAFNNFNTQSFAEPEPAHSFGQNGYSYKRPS